MVEHKRVTGARPPHNGALETIVLNVDASGDAQHLFRDSLEREWLAAPLQKGLTSTSSPSSRQPWPRIVLTKVRNSSVSCLARKNSAASLPHEAFANRLTSELIRKPAKSWRRFLKMRGKGFWGRSEGQEVI